MDAVPRRLGDALDSCDMSAVLHDGESKRVDPPTLDQDRACAALPLIAALLIAFRVPAIVHLRRDRVERTWCLSAGACCLDLTKFGRIGTRPA